MTRGTDIERAIRELYDPLTGIPGPGLFYDRVQQAMHVAERESLTLAMMLIDLDFGAAGPPPVEDRKTVLRVTAERLLEQLRISDTVGRLDVDRFGAMLPSVYREGLPGVVGRVITALETPIETASGNVAVRARIGAVVRNDGEEDAQFLVGRVLQDQAARFAAEQQQLATAQAAPAAAPASEPTPAPAPAVAPVEQTAWPTAPAAATEAPVDQLATQAAAQPAAETPAAVPAEAAPQPAVAEPAAAEPVVTTTVPVPPPAAESAVAPPQQAPVASEGVPVPAAAPPPGGTATPAGGPPPPAPGSPAAGATPAAQDPAAASAEAAPAAAEHAPVPPPQAPPSADAAEAA